MRKSDPQKLKHEVSQAIKAEREFDMLEGFLDDWDMLTLERLGKAVDDDQRREAQAMHMISKHFRRAYRTFMDTGKLATAQLNREEAKQNRH